MVNRQSKGIMIQPIGGYFELELPHFNAYHPQAIAVNSGRFGLEYLLRCRQYKKVYVPYFTCDTAIEPIQKLGIPYEFYRIDRAMQIPEDVKLETGEALLYTNYWGLQNRYCEELAARFGHQLILDYTQAFFSRPIPGIDTFYSCRKFFGVPDGGYLYTDAVADFELEQDTSFTHMDSLIKRIDLSPEAGYEDFHRASTYFHQAPLRSMSRFTERMMESIDYEQVAQRRIANYKHLQKALGGKDLEEGEVPMIFPYATDEGQDLRKLLISHKVFVAKYWPNVDEWAGKDAIETWLANHVLPLPIDQRYGEDEMNYIIQIISSHHEK